MKIILIILAVLLSSFIIFLIYRMRLGHVVGVHYYYFERIYDKIMEETQSKELALKAALDAFKACPILKRLTEKDYEQIVEILKVSPFPERVIKSIVLKMNTKASLKALQSPDLLTQMAAVGQNKEIQR